MREPTACVRRTAPATTSAWSSSSAVRPDELLPSQPEHRAAAPSVSEITPGRGSGVLQGARTDEVHEFLMGHRLTLRSELVEPLVPERRPARPRSARRSKGRGRTQACSAARQRSAPRRLRTDLDRRPRARGRAARSGTSSRVLTPRATRSARMATVFAATESPSALSTQPKETSACASQPVPAASSTASVAYRSAASRSFWRRATSLSGASAMRTRLPRSPSSRRRGTASSNLARASTIDPPPSRVAMPSVASGPHVPTARHARRTPQGLRPRCAASSPGRRVQRRPGAPEQGKDQGLGRATVLGQPQRLVRMGSGCTEFTARSRRSRRRCGPRRAESGARPRDRPRASSPSSARPRLPSLGGTRTHEGRGSPQATSRD